jgi:hypothetical protein
MPALGVTTTSDVIVEPTVDDASELAGEDDAPDRVVELSAVVEAEGVVVPLNWRASMAA